MLGSLGIKGVLITGMLTFLSLLFIEMNVVGAEYGGHDLYTSLAQLEVLWHNDIKVVKQMEEVIRKMEIVTKAFKL